MPEPKLLDQVRQTARLKHFSLRMERAYAQWVYRLVVHHGKRQREMGAREIQAFLAWLAMERKVAVRASSSSGHRASSQAQRDIAMLDSRLNGTRGDGAQRAVDERMRTT